MEKEKESYLSKIIEISQMQKAQEKKMDRAIENIKIQETLSEKYRKTI